MTMLSWNKDILISFYLNQTTFLSFPGPQAFLEISNNVFSNSTVITGISDLILTLRENNLAVSTKYGDILSFVLQVCVCVCVLSGSVISGSATPWTTAHQAPLFMEFSR